MSQQYSYHQGSPPAVSPASSPPQYYTHQQQNGTDNKSIKQPDEAEAQDGRGFAIKRKPLVTQSSVEGPLARSEKAPSPTDRRPRPRHHVLRFWYWEILTLAAATGLLIAITLILAEFDGQEVPDWPFSINLNSLIALLSTLFRAALILVVAEVVSQAKWSWFLQPQPLHDLRAFDYASRSIWGAIRLLGVAWKSPLAMLGCVVTILSLTVGPFTQQAIRTTVCQKSVNANSTVPVASWAPGSSSYFRYQSGIFKPATDLKGFVLNGLSTPGGNDTAVRATCPTGNCTFGGFQHSRSPDAETTLVDPSYSYETIGMCSKCMDVTSFVEDGAWGGLRNFSDYTNYTIFTETVNMSITLNTGAESLRYMALASGNLEWTTSKSTDDFKLATKESLFNVTVLSASKTNCTDTDDGCRFPQIANGTRGLADDVVAMSCALYPCTKRYLANVADGELRETLVGEPKMMRVNWLDNQLNDQVTGGLMQTAVSHNWTGLEEPCVINDVPYYSTNISLAGLEESYEEGKERVYNYTAYDPDTGEEIAARAPERCLYGFNGWYGMAISQWLEELLGTGCNYYVNQGTSVDCLENWWLEPLFNNWTATPDTIQTSFTSMTDTMTNFFRRTGYDIVTQETAAAMGMVQTTTVCTVFAWRWMSLPFLMLVFCMALLLSIVGVGWMDNQLPVWKSNPLPLVYYASSIGRGQENAGQPLMDLKAVSKDSHGRSVKLDKGVDGGFHDVRSSRERQTVIEGCVPGSNQESESESSGFFSRRRRVRT